MAIAKILLNGVTQMDVTQDTVTAATLLSSYTATKNDGTKVIGTATAGYDTSDGTAVASDVASGKIFYTSTGRSVGSLIIPSLQTKTSTYTPTTSTQTDSILPDNGYALSSVGITVNPIPSAYVIPSGTLSITSNASGIDVGSYSSVDVDVAGGGGTRTATITGSGTNDGVYVQLGQTKYYSAGTFDFSAGDELLLYASSGQTNSITINGVDAKYSDAGGVQQLTIVLPDNDVSIYLRASIGTGNVSIVTNEHAVYENKIINRTIFGTYENSFLRTVGSYAFNYCSYLTNISLPNCTKVETYGFGYCSRLASGIFMSCSVIGSSAFKNCGSLNTLIFSKPSTFGGTINTNAFASCYNLLSLYLFTSSSFLYALGNANAFSSTPISTYTTSTGGVYGSIFVPESLYDTYRTSTNWAAYAARFVSMTNADIEALISSIS